MSGVLAARPVSEAWLLFVRIVVTVALDVCLPCNLLASSMNATCGFVQGMFPVCVCVCVIRSYISMPVLQHGSRLGQSMDNLFVFEAIMHLDLFVACGSAIV